MILFTLDEVTAILHMIKNTQERCRRSLIEAFDTAVGGRTLMKKTFNHPAGLLAVLLLILLSGCTAPDVPETMPETVPEVTSAVIEQESHSLLGAEILSASAVEELKKNRECIPAGDERAVLYFNGTELPCHSDRHVFYATVSQPMNENTQPDGVLSGPDGYRAVLEEAIHRENLTKLIESGNTLMLYFFGETDYFTAEVMLTYLPVISITMDNGADPGDSLRGAVFTVYDSAAANPLKRYAQSKAEIKIRGASSSSLPKKSFRIDLKDENGENRDMSFFGMRKDDDWILTAMYSDESKIRDMTGWQLWSEMNSAYPGITGSCAPEMRYVEVLLNGQYQGLYLFIEKFDAKTMELEDGDVLFKATSWDVPDSAGLKRQPDSSLRYRALEKKWPDTGTETTGTWDAIAEYIRVAYETDGAGFADGIADIASIENQLDYWIFNNVTMAGDNTFKNAYYAVKDGLVYTLPWDLDISFGLNWNGDPATNYLYREPNCISGTYDFQAGRRLLKYDSSAVDYVKKRWFELKETGVVTAESIIENSEANWNLIHASGAVSRECSRWPNVSYRDSLTYFSNVVRRRISWLDKYIDGLS